MKNGSARLNNDQVEGVSISGLSGDRLQIIVRSKTYYYTGTYWWDNINVVPTAPTGSIPWHETFFDQGNGATSDDGDTAWTATRYGYHQVNNEAFQVYYTGGDAVWRSEVIDISTAGSVSASMEIQGEGSLEADGQYQDHLRVYYRIDGGPEVLLAERLGTFNNNNYELISLDDVSGNTLELIVRAKTTGSTEYYRWDNISIVPNSSQISGNVWADNDSDGTLNNAEAGIPNVTVNLLTGVGGFIDTTTTDANGDFVFPDLDAGDYIIGIVPGSLPSDLKPTYDRDSDTVGLGNQAAMTLGGGDITDANFGYGPDDGNSGGGGGNTDGNGVISGQIWGDDDSDGTLNNAEAGLADVAVNLVTSVGSFVDTTTTDANGDFSFTGLAGGDYIVGVVTSSPALSGTKATYDRDSDTAGLGNQAAITLVDDDDVVNDANFGYGPDDGNTGGGGNTDGNGVISGQIWGDDDSDGTLNNAEVGLEGVNVNLVTSVGSFVDSTTTDTNGDFSFTGLAGGDYIVGVVTSSPALSGTKATFDRDSDTAGLGNQAAITLVDDDDVVNDANFGYGPTTATAAAAVATPMATASSPAKSGAMTTATAHSTTQKLASKALTSTSSPALAASLTAPPPILTAISASLALLAAITSSA